MSAKVIRAWAAKPAKRALALETVGLGPSRRFTEVFKIKVLVALVLFAALAAMARASDHFDSPATVANPQADIGDVYAWISPEGRQLNLAMTIQGHTFSDKVQYGLHIDSGKVFGHTSASTTIVCHFAAANAVNCKVGNADSASGDPTNPLGLEGRNHRFRVYAALRDDPFYNNLKGLLGAYAAVSAAIKNGVPVDAAGCRQFNEATAKTILDQMGHTDGGPAQNLLYNWTASAIVISVDLDVVSKGGTLLAVLEDIIGLADVLEFLLGGFVARVAVGMKLHRELAIGPLQLIGIGRFRHTQNVVKVLLCHSSTDARLKIR